MILMNLILWNICSKIVGAIIEKPIMLTILPTLGCNFGCNYCFEKTYKRNNEQWSAECINKIYMLKTVTI